MADTADAAGFTCQAITVTGATAELGPTLPSEYVFFFLRSRHRAPQDLEETQLRDIPIQLGRLAVLREKPLVSLLNLVAPADDEVCAQELTRYVQAIGGTGTIVSSSVGGEWAATAARLAALSRITRVQVIMAVGWGSTEEMPSFSDDDPDAVVTALVTMLSVGVEAPGAGGERLRAGAIGTLVLRNSLADSRLLSTLAATHVRTGAPLMCELPASGTASTEAAQAVAAAALSTLHALKAAGVNLRRVLVSHSQHLLLAPGGLQALLREGVRCCFTGMGMSWCVAGARAADEPWLLPQTDEAVAAAVVELCRDGFASQLLLSPCIESRLQMCAYGGGGYAHLHRSFLPRARRLGLSPDDEARLTAGNAAELFCFWTQPPPPQRVVKQWTCDACHRAFVEAVNEAETLPEDQPYYEKFSFRYCTTACLSSHREAGFVQPFSCPPPR
jgi:phosphotriesterase-related protein